MPLKKISYIEKLVLQKNDGKLMKMREPESVAQDKCIFSIAFLYAHQKKT